MTDTESNEKRFERLEKKLNLLTAIAVGQAILLAILVVFLTIQQFMPSTLTFVLMLVAVGTFAYFFRSQIPTWFGQLSRFAFAQLFAAQKSDGFKDIK